MSYTMFRHSFITRTGIDNQTAVSHQAWYTVMNKPDAIA
jgi:hypothetical protein